MAEPAADEHQDVPGRKLSNAEMLMRILVNYALQGKQFAIEAVLDRYEGKPVRAQQINVQDHSIEELIDRQKVALLNTLVPTKD